jgi:type VI secretion system secreted protein Hcp
MAKKFKSCWKRVLLWLGIALIYALPLAAVRGAFDMFLKIDGVPGESTDDKHKDWADVLSFSHGVSQPAAAAQSSGGARTTERAEHRNFTVTKPLDKSSPKLLLFACNGSHIRQVTIEMCRNLGDKIRFLEVKLSDVIVSSVTPHGAAQSDTVPIEEVSFNYGKIEWNYTEVTADGKMAGTVSANWDLLTNKGN